MTDSTYTHLVIVADRSGSMSTIADDMNGGLEKFLEEQSKLDGKLLVDVVTFDSKVERVAIDSEVKDITFPIIVPRGTTSLNDGIGTAISDLGARLSYLEEDERPGKVIVLIITDGMENASREYRSQQIKDMVKEQQDKYNWEFVFLGANIDSFAVGGGYGVTQHSTMNYTANSAGVASVLRSTTAYVTSRRLGKDASLS